MFKRQVHLCVLLFAFAFAQVGLLTHEVSHYTNLNQAKLSQTNLNQSLVSNQANDLKLTSASPNQQDSPNNPDQDTTKTHCVTCLAFSGIASANMVVLLVFAFDSAAESYFSLTKTAHLTRYFSNSHARAPPKLV